MNETPHKAPAVEPGDVRPDCGMAKMLVPAILWGVALLSFLDILASLTVSICVLAGTRIFLCMATLRGSVVARRVLQLYLILLVLFAFIFGFMKMAERPGHSVIVMGVGTFYALVLAYLLLNKNVKRYFENTKDL